MTLVNVRMKRFVEIKFCRIMWLKRDMKLIKFYSEHLFVYSRLKKLPLCAYEFTYMNKQFVTANVAIQNVRH